MGAERQRSDKLIVGIFDAIALLAMMLASYIAGRRDGYWKCKQESKHELSKEADNANT